jgi:cyclohexadienyl dehydratase
MPIVRHRAAAAIARALTVTLLLPALAGAGELLRAGTSGDYPPFSVVTPAGERAGFDIDVATLLSRHLDRRLEFVAFRWPDLGEDSRRGRFDLVASGVTIRPERALFGRFTRPYAVSEAVVLIRRADAARFASLADLDRAPHRVSVNRGGYLEGVARSTFDGAAVEPVTDNLHLAAPLMAGRAEALVTDSIEERPLLAAQPELMRLASLTRDRKAIFVPAASPAGGDSRALHAAVDTWLATAAGAIEPLRLRWLGPAAGMSPGEARAEAIAALVDQRCGLAPWIAAYKSAARLPIEDRAREEKVLEAAARRARAADLPEERIVALFRALIEASKDIQRAAAPLESAVDLDALRAVLGELDERLVAELAAGRDIDAAGRHRLTFAIEALGWPGLGEARRREIAVALASALP